MVHNSLDISYREAVVMAYTTVFGHIYESETTNGLGNWRIAFCLQASMIPMISNDKQRSNDNPPCEETNCVQHLPGQVPTVRISVLLDFFHSNTVVFSTSKQLYSETACAVERIPSMAPRFCKIHPCCLVSDNVPYTCIPRLDNG